MTDEEREQARQNAKDMIAAGKFGAANGFHRRKTKRFQEIAAEHAREKADVIVDRLDAMLNSQDKRIQLEAIREYRAMEDWSVKNSREDEKELRKLTNDQLDERLLEMMGEAMGVDFTLSDDDIQDVEVVAGELESGDDE